MKWVRLNIHGLEYTWDIIWEWSLVLLSMGIDHRILEENNSPYIEVQDADLSKAENEIIQYENEKESKEEHKASYNNFYSIESSIWILFSIFLFNIIVFNAPLPFFEYGCFYGFAIYKGEIWRFITSLFLHKDYSHLFSNLFWELVFLYFLLKKIPPGLCWLMILLTGIIGNLLNYLVQPINHISVGFSTSVFGSIGLGIGVNLPKDIKGSFIFFMVGLSLFAILGVGSPNVDVLSHLFGLLTGFFLGIVIDNKFNKVNTIHEIVFYIISFLIVAVSWILALNLGHHYELNLS